jgi:DNA-binding NtrC family response regulator
LFLDEIGELPIELQPKLLRFLEAREVHPLGEPHPIRVNVRVVCATNADLTERIKQRLFREDLFFRLNTVQLDIPPLRARRDEIPRLAHLFLAAHAEEFRKGTLRLTGAALEQLLVYAWPGNIRELSNEMRRAAALADENGEVGPALFSPRVLGSRHAAPESAAPPPPHRGTQPLAAAVASLERTMIEGALRQAGGRMDEAARLLGLSRKGLFLKRKRYRIES